MSVLTFSCSSFLPVYEVKPRSIQSEPKHISYRFLMQIIGVTNGETHTEIIAEYISRGLTEFRTAVIDIQISLPSFLGIAKETNG